MVFILVDVEAGGGPTPYSGTMTEFGAVELESGMAFHGVIWDAKPSADNPAVPDLACALPVRPLNAVMNDFDGWLAGFGERVVFVSDNPAYDFMWIADAFDRCGLGNPFGHSGRRISDFYAGLEGNWKKTQGWKKLRVTTHDHNPVNDSKGNREALLTLLGGTL